MKVEIIGERKTGTNYTKKMLERNFKVECINQGWKHRLISDLNKDVAYVFCIRDLQTWLKSLYTKPYHMLYVSKNNLSFGQFLRTFAQDWKGERYSFPMTMYCRKYRAVMEVLNNPEYKAFCVKHEDVIEDWESVFTNLKHKLGLEQKQPLTNIVKKVDDIGIRQKKYTDNKYFSIAEKDLKFIRRKSDKEVLQYFGYKI